MSASLIAPRTRHTERRQSEISASPGLLSRARDVLDLLKLRVNLLVAVTAFVGLRLAEASLGRAASLAPALHVVLGTLLLGAGTSALNQLLERDLDARMLRTCGRPLPGGRLPAALARALGVLLNVSGIAYLALLVNPACSAVGALCAAIYVFAYTPLKRYTTASLLVGAVAGAMPPLIGWAGAAGRLEAAAWSLFAIQFIWQVPHFLAIGWIYREDYRRAGFRVLPALHGAGHATALHTVAWSLALVPASLAPAVFFRLGGPVYSLTALGLGAAFLAAAVVFAVRRTRRSARALVIVSVVYLPLLFLSLVADA
jgi:protoheme IX farnesyltransferase